FAVRLHSANRMTRAIEEYEAALGLNPDFPEALNNLAWILATASNREIRNGGQAVSLAERACSLTTSSNALMIGTAAAAYAEQRQFSKAAALAEEACRLAEESGEAQILNKNRELLQLYRSGRAYREPHR